MRTPTDSEAAAVPRGTWIPLIGLTAVVVLGSALGLWMVASAGAASSSSPSTSAADHDGTGASAHDHAAAGTVAMPGLEPGAKAAGHDDPAPGEDGEHGDHGSGMSEEEMAAEGHTADATAHAPAAAPVSSPDHAEPAGRPLAATVAGFGLVNAAVLLAAVLVGRRRLPHRPRVRTTAGSPS